MNTQYVETSSKDYQTSKCTGSEWKDKPNKDSSSQQPRQKKGPGKLDRTSYKCNKGQQQNNNTKGLSIMQHLEELNLKKSKEERLRDRDRIRQYQMNKINNREWKDNSVRSRLISVVFMIIGKLGKRMSQSNQKIQIKRALNSGKL